MKKLLWATFLAMLLAGSLSAQSAAGTATAQGQTQPRTPDARIEAAMTAAARADIPASLLENKRAEGEAKGVPQERIATAIETRLAALVRASNAMGRADVEGRSAGDLSVAADAIEAGVSESAVIEIARDAPAERRAVAVAVLADLVRLGQSSEQALARVSAAVLSSAALAGLHAEVASQLRLGGLTSTLDAAGIVRIP
jgi:hypothetical protein